MRKQKQKKRQKTHLPDNFTELHGLSVKGIKPDLGPMLLLYTAHILMPVALLYKCVHQTFVASSILVIIPTIPFWLSYCIEYVTWQLPVSMGVHSTKLQPIFCLKYFTSLIAGGVTATTIKKRLMSLRSCN